MINLRPYQSELISEIKDAWQSGHQNVLAVAPTGSGKTILFSDIIYEHVGNSVAIAHRQELVGQMSVALARFGVPHRILAPDNVVKWIISCQIAEVGRSYYDSNARCAVAGVGTLNSWAKPTSRQYHALMRWASQVTLWIQDEVHHLCKDNMWGNAVALFPNARGLGVTATPERTDGKGLGRHADGLMDKMVVGPGMRELIDMKFLTDYRVFCPPSDLDLSDVKTGVDGDFVRGQLALKTKRSTVMGHVVEHYLKLAPGKLGVTFAPDIDTATDFNVMFQRAGVPSEVVSSKTPDKLRIEIMRRFKRGELKQLVNVDLFGEGFDLPAIEVVSMARATQSYGLFVQQFGRACRLMDGKDRALIIDHVGNVIRHGLPDRPRVWTLDRRDKKASKNEPGTIPWKICLSCTAPYEAFHPCCPFCGWTPVPTDRSKPEFVDGDLHELTPEALAAMRGEIARIDQHPDRVLDMMSAAGHPAKIAYAARNKHIEKMQAQMELRDAISWYGGLQRSLGRTDRMGWRAFYHQFGIDVMSAQSLPRADAEALTAKINSVISCARPDTLTRK